MAKQNSKIKDMTRRAREHEKGMWGVIDDEVDALVDRRQKARLAMLLGATALIAGILTLLTFFL